MSLTYYPPPPSSGSHSIVPYGQESRGRERQRKNRKKRTRWGDYADFTFSSALSALPKCIPGGLTMEQLETLLIRVRMEEIGRKIIHSELDLDLEELDRSPSPEPIYDKDGKRVNTREQRAKDKLNEERQSLVELSTAMFPGFKPPADYTPGSSKKMRKILIPIDKHPEYNFIGLIIGPRGNTQKRMERETGAKIAIRGKGSMKEGKANKNNQGDEHEPLHVLITADTEAQLDKACKMVSQLLIPVDEGKNEHKRAQLRELAEINGTLRDRVWMAPTERSFEPSNVKCAICGERSHPTPDCPLKGKTNPIMPEDVKAMDNEYEKFLSEIGEEVPQNKEQDPNEAYQQFMNAVGGQPSAQSVAAPPWSQQAYGAAPWAAQQPAPWATQQMPPEQQPAPWATQQQQQSAPWASQQQQQTEQGAPWSNYPQNYYNQQ